jgi:hypothetical protein
MHGGCHARQAQRPGLSGDFTPNELIGVVGGRLRGHDGSVWIRGVLRGPRHDARDGPANRARLCRDAGPCAVCVVMALGIERRVSSLRSACPGGACSTRDHHFTLMAAQAATHDNPPRVRGFEIACERPSQHTTEELSCIQGDREDLADAVTARNACSTSWAVRDGTAGKRGSTARSAPSPNSQEAWGRDGTLSGLAIGSVTRGRLRFK